MQVSQDVIEFLRRTDTCTVSNAIETLNVRMRNEGYVQGGSRCMFRDLPPVVGYAVTGRMRAAAPPISGRWYYQHPDWWRYVSGIEGPKIIVIEDVDGAPGTGALFGEIHARISRAFGCVGYLTNGTIRDLRQVEALGFQCFAREATVSHSYAHIIEFGEAVSVGGLRVSPGDLLHGDCNGIHSIPVAVAGHLRNAVEQVEAHEAQLIELCKSPDFSISRLEQVLARAGK